MHELGVTENLLDMVEREAKVHGIAKVKSLRIVIGEMSLVTKDIIESHWKELSRGTRAEGAKLEFVTRPACWTCLNCKETVNIKKTLRCPHCGSMEMKLERGQEFYLDSIVGD